MLFSLVIFGIIFGVLFSMFLHIIHTKSDIEARETLVKNTYDLVEQLNTKLQNYTIDYEEYFNRIEVGCMAWTLQQGSTFSWDVTTWWSMLWYCTKWTAYGNNSALENAMTYVSNESQHNLYYCSSDTSNNLSTDIEQEENWRLTVYSGSCAINFFNKYSASANYTLNGNRFFQPYWAYKMQFIDAKADVDDVIWRAGDDDDTDLWMWSTAIVDNTNIKELYVISKDKKERIFFRRALIATWDWNWNGFIDAENEKLYAIQMLQLKAFDGWMNHDFDSVTYKWVYDGTTDTRACDSSAWFVCTGPTLGSTIYSWYNLPANGNDWWINITNNDVSISDWNIQIFPIKDPEYAWNENQYQQNPFVRLYLKTTIYWRNWVWKLQTEDLDAITFDVQTSFNIKTNY